MSALDHDLSSYQYKIRLVFSCSKTNGQRQQIFGYFLKNIPFLIIFHKVLRSGGEVQYKIVESTLKYPYIFVETCFLITSIYQGNFFLSSVFLYYMLRYEFIILLLISVALFIL